jgi:hypothetical protein
MNDSSFDKLRVNGFFEFPFCTDDKYVPDKFVGVASFNQMPDKLSKAVKQ